MPFRKPSPVTRVRPWVWRISPKCCGTITSSTTRPIPSGLTVTDLGRFSGALRLRYFSGGPLIEDDSVTWGPTVLLNGRIGVRVTDSLSMAVDAFNLLDREDDDIAYFYPSRLPGEPTEGFEDVHFHPMEKPSVRLSLIWRYL